MTAANDLGRGKYAAPAVEKSVRKVQRQARDIIAVKRRQATQEAGGGVVPSRSFSRFIRRLIGIIERRFAEETKNTSGHVIHAVNVFL